MHGAHATGDWPISAHLPHSRPQPGRRVGRGLRSPTGECLPFPTTDDTIGYKEHHT
jgi:hypothetical protein